MSSKNTNTDILIVCISGTPTKAHFESSNLSLTTIDTAQAGAFAAFTVDVLVYPLDTIKTRIQAPDYHRLYTNASTKQINRALFRGLYQGIGSVVIATLPSCKENPAT